MYNGIIEKINMPDETYVYVFDYCTCSIYELVIKHVRELQNEEIADLLSYNGFDNDEISYMTSDTRLTIKQNLIPIYV